MSVYKRYFFLLVFVVLSSVAFGQATSSPYSAFGVGEPFGNSLIQSQGMGGVGVSQPQFWSLNNQNPALLVFNYYTVFQAGALIESRTLKGDTLSQKNVNGNLNYLVTAFPVKPGKWTTSFGLMPFTKVNYKLSYTEPIENDTILASVFNQGTGGLAQFYWSNGIRLSKNFSFGVKASYVFGSANTEYTNYAPTTVDPSVPYVPFNVAIKQQLYVKDFMFTGGLSFSQDSVGKGDYRISAGAVYNFSAGLNTQKTTTLERRLTSGNPVTSDTIVQKGGSIFIPSSVIIGASISKGTKWSTAAEFSFQNWANFSSIDYGNEGLSQSWKASLGGEYTPDQLAFKNYLKRITYRAGFSYEKSPITVNNQQLKDIGINFGLSMPAGRSSLDWGFRAGKRGNKSADVLEETYYKIYFGITFNDQWFIKRKFD